MVYMVYLDVNAVFFCLQQGTSNRSEYVCELNIKKSKTVVELSAEVVILDLEASPSVLNPKTKVTFTLQLSVSKQICHSYVMYFLFFITV